MQTELQRQHQANKAIRANLNKLASKNFDKPIDLKPWRHWNEIRWSAVALNGSQSPLPDQPKSPPIVARWHGAAVINTFGTLIVTPYANAPLPTRRPGAMSEPLLAKFIRHFICLNYGITKKDLLSIRRLDRMVKARQMVAYLLRYYTSWSLPSIGRYLGDKDHTTIIHAVRCIERKCRATIEFAQLTAMIDEIIFCVKHGADPLPHLTAPLDGFSDILKSLAGQPRHQRSTRQSESAPEVVPASGAQPIAAPTE